MPQSNRSKALARLHLRATPLDPVSLYDLAVALDPADPVRARGLKLSERVTRRHGPTEVQLLVDASAQADYVALLRHSDHLLALPTGIEGSLLKSLAQGVPDPSLRAALRPYHQRPWFGRLMATSLENAGLRDVLALLDENPQTDQLPPGFLTALQERLVTADMWQEARRLAIVRGGVAPAAIDSFVLPGSVPDAAGRPMTWSIADSGVDLSVDWRPSGVAFEIAGGTTVAIMERLTSMPPGPYELVHSMTLLDTAGFSAWWDVKCKGAPVPEETFRQRIAVSERNERYRISIPEGCNYQHWQLRVLGEDGQRPILFELKRLDLRPEHNRPRTQ